MIISSTILSQIPQVDGRMDVTEHHLHSDGTIQVFNYLADASLNLQVVADSRALLINADLTERELAVEIASHYEIPLTDLEVMRRIYPAEWAAFQTSTDETVSYFRAVFAKSKVIYRTDPLTIAGFGALVALGIMTQHRANEVLA